MVIRFFLTLAVLLANEACCSSASMTRGFFENVVQKGVNRGALQYKNQGKISMSSSFSETALLVKRKILPVLRDVQMSEESFIRKYNANSCDYFYMLREETDYDGFLAKTTLVEDGYGILPDVAEYWKHNATLLKFGIMRGVGDAEVAYKEDLSWISHNMQLPETGFHGTEEEQMRERVFHWTLLAFEDPLARDYLAS